MIDEIQLGDEVRDLVSGMTGIVVAHILRLFGESQLLVQPEGTCDGRPIEPVVCAPRQLVLVGQDGLHLELREKLRATEREQANLAPHDPNDPRR